jgi:hypothetical protein
VCFFFFFPSFLNKVVGEFTDILLDVLSKRVSPQWSHLSLGDVNSLLDRLVASPDNEARKAIFRKEVFVLHPHEQRWIVRIIIRDMKLGIKVGYDCWQQGGMVWWCGKGVVLGKQCQKTCVKKLRHDDCFGVKRRRRYLQAIPGCFCLFDVLNVSPTNVFVKHASC